MKQRMYATTPRHSNRSVTWRTVKAILLLSPGGEGNSVVLNCTLNTQRTEQVMKAQLVNQQLRKN